MIPSWVLVFQNINLFYNDTNQTFTVGSSVGLTLGSFLFGYIGQYFHWRFIFHMTSVCGIVWSAFWYLLVYDSPTQHPSISIKEKEYIESSLKPSNDGTKVRWSECLYVYAQNSIFQVNFLSSDSHSLERYHNQCTPFCMYIGREFVYVDMGGNGHVFSCISQEFLRIEFK